MVLEWNEQEGYLPVRRLPLCALISPQFVRIRDDKRVTYEQLPMRQLTDIVEIERADARATEIALPESEVLAREVFRKTLKGNTMVRKLLLWKTNKEQANPSYPAYVAYVTDYSPARKTPLEREIRISDSPEQIEELYDQLRAKYVVGGWQPVE
jgi:hypothetical protein